MYEYYSRRPARGPRGPAAARRPTAGCSSSTTRPAGCCACPTTWSAARSHDLGLPPGLVAAALGRTAESDDIYVAGEHVLVVSSAPATWQGREVGAVVTLRDHTELRSVTGELDVVRALTESLRSQNHEAANRLHTVVSLIEMGRPEEAVDFATEELQVAQQLTDRVVGAVGDPVVAALLLGKTAEAAERGIDLPIDRRPAATGPTSPPRDLVTVLGNLVDNALRRGGRTRPAAGWRCAWSGDADVVRVVVGDSGPGLDRRGGRARPRARLDHEGLGERLGGRGVGLALVGQVARRHGGDVADRQLRRSAARGSPSRCTRPTPEGRAVTVRVLVVEDEALAAEAHAAYIARVRGFEVAGVARSAARGGAVPDRRTGTST